LTKHTADGTGSPLSGLDMTDMGARVTAADTQNKNAAQLYRNAVKGTIAHYVRSVRDVLLGLYKGNEQKLGDWGFEVDTSARGGGNAPAPALEKT
jgi:hypothetical protein